MATSANMLSTAIFTSPTNSSMDADNDALDPLFPHSLTWLIVVGIIYLFIVVITLVGNSFVVAAYAVDIKIRSRPANLLILNLSISDFFVGITLIFNYLFLLYDMWPLGEIPCKLWIVLDYTCSYMSVITITLISLDRYWMVKKKLAYRTFQTKKRILITLAICWTLVISFYTITAFGYGAMTGTSHVDFSEDCEMEYLYDVSFSAVMIFVEFVIPFIVILYLNIIVYKNVRLRSGPELVRKKPDAVPSINTKSLGTDTTSGLAVSGSPATTRSSVPIVTVSYVTKQDGVTDGNPDVVTGGEKWNKSSTKEEYEMEESSEVSKASDEGIIAEKDNQIVRNGISNPASDCCEQVVSDSSITQTQINLGEEKNSNNSGNQAKGDPDNQNNEPSDDAGKLDTLNKKNVSNSTLGKPIVIETRLLSASATTLNSLSLSVDGNSSQTIGSRENLKKKTREFRRYRRAAIVLFVLVTAFAICWMPYQITSIIMTVLGDESVNELLSEIMTNLLWCNSTINPFLYALVTVQFRRNFIRFLGLEHVTCGKKKGAPYADTPDRINTSDPTTCDDS